MIEGQKVTKEKTRNSIEVDGYFINIAKESLTGDLREAVIEKIKESAIDLTNTLTRIRYNVIAPLFPTTKDRLIFFALATLLVDETGNKVFTYGKDESMFLVSNGNTNTSKFTFGIAEEPKATSETGGIIKKMTAVDPMMPKGKKEPAGEVAPPVEPVVEIPAGEVAPPVEEPAKAEPAGDVEPVLEPVVEIPAGEVASPVEEPTKEIPAGEVASPVEEPTKTVEETKATSKKK